MLGVPADLGWAALRAANPATHGYRRDRQGATKHSAAPKGRSVSDLPSMLMEERNALMVAVDEGDRAAAAAVFRALSTPGRLAVFDALVDELTVPQLRVQIGALDPSRDLAVLRDAGLVHQLPGIAPRRWQQVPGARETIASLAMNTNT